MSLLSWIDPSSLRCAVSASTCFLVLRRPPARRNQESRGSEERSAISPGDGVTLSAGGRIAGRDQDIIVNH